MQEVVPTWTSVTEGGGCTLVRDEGGALEKRGGKDAYDTCAVSEQEISRRAGGGSEPQGLTWRAGTADKSFVMGLSRGEGGTGWPQKRDFAMYCSGDGRLNIYEQGSWVRGSGYAGSFGQYRPSDQLEIRVVADTVSYHLNGRLLHTSAQKPAFPLRADCLFYQPGGRVEGVRLRC